MADVALAAGVREAGEDTKRRRWQHGMKIQQSNVDVCVEPASEEMKRLPLPPGAPTFYLLPFYLHRTCPREEEVAGGELPLHDVGGNIQDVPKVPKS